MTLISKLLIIIGIGAVSLSACQSSSSTSNFNAEKFVQVCSGFGCIYRQKLAFSASDMNKIRSVLDATVQDAGAERLALAELVAWKEQLGQQKLKMRRDTRLSYQRDRGIRGQMDCVDESSNTLAFLQFLEKEGLLKHHQPRRIAGRGFLFDGRYPHKTAVIRDKNGDDWAVDSWKKHGGEPPQVVDLAIWRTERASEYR